MKKGGVSSGWRSLLVTAVMMLPGSLKRCVGGSAMHSIGEMRKGGGRHSGGKGAEEKKETSPRGTCRADPADPLRPSKVRRESVAQQGIEDRPGYETRSKRKRKPLRKRTLDGDERGPVVHARRAAFRTWGGIRRSKKPFRGEGVEPQRQGVSGSTSPEAPR